MEEPAISVVIPAYNRAKLIGQTLCSLLHQSLPADEIIVVDDGSTDSTAEAAEVAFSVFSRQLSAGGRLPEFKVIRQENAGPGAARNRGFVESKGGFIHFFDSDDIAALNKHEVQVRALQDTGSDIAYGPWVKGHIKEHGAGNTERGPQKDQKRYSFQPEAFVFQQRGLPQGDLIKELLTCWSIVPQACMFRRSIIEKSGGFPDDMFVAEDQLVFLRCLLAGARVVHTPQTLAFYRLGDAGKLTEAEEGHRRRITDWGTFLERSREECAPHGIVPDRWLGYRMRLWSAQKERAALDSSERGGRSARQDLLFGALFRLRRWWGGLKSRAVGHRQSAAFRSGRLTPFQAALFPGS